MYTTVQFQFTAGVGMPEPEVVSHNSEASRPEGSLPFEIVRLRDGSTTLDLFMGWDDVSAAEQCLVLIEALQDARNRALRRLALRDGEWAATPPFDEEAVGAAERTERDEAQVAS